MKLLIPCASVLTFLAIFAGVLVLAHDKTGVGLDIGADAVPPSTIVESFNVYQFCARADVRVYNGVDLDASPHPTYYAERLLAGRVVEQVKWMDNGGGSGVHSVFVNGVPRDTAIEIPLGNASLCMRTPKDAR